MDSLTMRVVLAHVEGRKVALVWWTKACRPAALTSTSDGSHCQLSHRRGMSNSVSPCHVHSPAPGFGQAGRSLSATVTQPL